MGTKLHQINNLFTTLQQNNCKVTVRLETSDISVVVSDNISLKATSILGGLNQLKGSMERLLECCNRDAVRNTMLKHEEIFRQQVHELHRLYRDQKMLMAELGNKENLHSFPSEVAAAVADARTRIWSSSSNSDTSHSSHVSKLHQSAVQLTSESNYLNPCSARAGPRSRELSICSHDQSSVHFESFDLKQPAEKYTSKGATSINDQTTRYESWLKEKQSLEGPLSWTDDGSEIELTLSIGCSSDKKKRTLNWLHPNNNICCSEQSPSDARPLLLSRQVRQEKGEECGDSPAALDREKLKSSPVFFEHLI